jgi:predicted Zn-dependent protease
MWSISQRWGLVEEKQYWQVIATEIACSVEAVKMNAKRLGLSVVVDRGRRSTTTNDLSEELPSVEEALKVLASVRIGKK